MVPTRLRELAGDLVRDGYDVIEANTNGVAVQKPEARNFQEAWTASLNADHDIAEFGPGGTSAIIGSLSHGHLNCISWNMHAGLRGCECIEPTVVGKRKDMKCACKARPILDEDGNYSISLLEGHDRDWYLDLQTGLDWEVLRWQMDEEEPEAASVMSVSLNKSNSNAMNAGHLEIFTATTNMMHPDPLNGIVTYEPVSEQLIKLYGPLVESPTLFMFPASLWRRLVEGVSISQG